MTNPLESTNPHGIRVVADRAPIREDVKVAFAKGSQRATKGIDTLVRPQRRRSRASASVKRINK
jgi:hypothetical protein